MTVWIGDDTELNVIGTKVLEFCARGLLWALLAVLTGCTSHSGSWNWSLLPPPLVEQLSEEDVRLADDTLQKALEVAVSGVTFTWENTANGHAGTVTPKASYLAESGQFCRDYVETITIGSRTELYENAACKDGGGQWLPTS